MANRASDKLVPLANQIFVARSGSASDTQMVTAYLQVMLGHHEAEHNEPPQVKTAAHLAHKQVYKYKDALSCGLIVGGWDRYEGGSVYSVPTNGSMIRVPFAIGGSGSTYIYGWCDKNWKNGMTKEECLKFVVAGISHGINRDGASGGMVRTVVVDSSGIERNAIGDGIPIPAGGVRGPTIVQ